MILKIVKSIPNDAMDGQYLYMEARSLKYAATHLYLASNTFDKIEIDLCDEIPGNVLQYLRKQSNKVEVTIPDETTKHIVDLLCELYPEKSGRIRRYNLLHKDLKEALI